MKKIFYTLFLAIALVIFNGCAKLDVQNPNEPDVKKALSRSNDLKGLLAGAFVDVYSIFWGWNTPTFYSSVHLEWTADHVTMTNNYRAMWSQFKVEPRPTFNNTLAFSDLDIISEPYRRLFAANTNANDVIRRIEKDGVQVGTNGSETQMVLACAYFVKGLAYGYLANIFDKAVIVEPDTDLNKLTKDDLVDYKQVLNASIRALDKAIQIASNNTFTLDASFINTPSPLNNVKLARLARTYAANFIVQNARNRAENSATDWNKVLNYTQNGITEDFIIKLDGVNWDHALIGGAGLDWYWRVDLRIINLLDPNYPKRFPMATNATLPPANSIDKRLNLYFKYEPSLAFFRVTRGPQLRSHYRVKRYDDLYAAQSIGPCPFMYAYNNDLLKAEAMAMTGNLSGAINILNTGRRKTVGELPDIPNTATQAEVLKAIFYERDIDLLWSDFGIHFKDMRRRDALQKGTILHFPVPANVLANQQIPFYTYGGVNLADGKNTADGSNSWLNP
ncbi:MAG: hypothetical protein NZ519_01845 [Bacteroidia bacterium]|nr:hypothetical protein [Bacteroidia bacterium]MDW8300864.1 hypothetical protein [Bacteroidia bacterium]